MTGLVCPTINYNALEKFPKLLSDLKLRPPARLFLLVTMFLMNFGTMLAFLSVQVYAFLDEKNKGWELKLASGVLLASSLIISQFAISSYGVEAFTINIF